jgi:YfiH family protein
MCGASWLVTDRTVGSSQGAFAFNNVAVHVGDDPEAVAANRSSLADALGVRGVVFTRAAHSDAVAYVVAPGPDVEGVDALITDRPGVALAAQGADCVPIAVATPDGWIAAVHCGWKGVVLGVVPAALNALRERGAILDGAAAHLGPSICADCYPVDGDRVDEVAAVAPGAVRRTDSGGHIDLRSAVLAQLRGNDVLDVTWDARCTAETADLYSHRRDGRTGRQAIVVVRPSRSEVGP